MSIKNLAVVENAFHRRKRGANKEIYSFFGTVAHRNNHIQIVILYFSVYQPVAFILNLFQNGTCCLFMSTKRFLIPSALQVEWIYWADIV